MAAAKKAPTSAPKRQVLVRLVEFRMDPRDIRDFEDNSNESFEDFLDSFRGYGAVNVIAEGIVEGEV